MKNITERQLKKCIFLEDVDDLEDILQKILNNEQISVTCCDCELSYCNLSEDDFINTDTVYNALAEYFDVSEIKSIHTDSYECIWIVYE